MKSVFAVLLVLVLLLSLAMADQVTVPNEFRAGTPARAAEVNENFAVLATESNAQDMRIEALEMMSTGPNITDQLICVGSAGWPFADGTGFFFRIDCTQTSDPTRLRRLRFADAINEGWVVSSYSDGVWILNELTW